MSAPFSYTFQIPLSLWLESDLVLLISASTELYPFFAFDDGRDPYNYQLTMFGSLAIWASELLSSWVAREVCPRSFICPFARSIHLASTTRKADRLGRVLDPPSAHSDLQIRFPSGCHQPGLGRDARVPRDCAYVRVDKRACLDGHAPIPYRKSPHISIG